jgi:selenocysteine lyase/cysteine desulfurase
VFISQQEHHSNDLIWRESKNVDLVVIPPDADTGSLSLTRLEEELRKYQDRALKLGSFTAASNVTGIRCDTKEVTRLLHQYGAYAAWDFAAAGPHIDIDMLGDDLDAVYLSPHKYVGGPGTPGILTARRSLFRNRVPSVPGGGTVLYVQPHGQRYLDNIEHREEGGTPAIVESIRAGLVLQLHHQAGPDWIEKQESEFLDRATSVWKKNPNLVILGSLEAKRVPIVSFLVKSPIASRRFVHHNFIVALLNDLFGIQTRGGCSCAG